MSGTASASTPPKATGKPALPKPASPKAATPKPASPKASTPKVASGASSPSSASKIATHQDPTSPEKVLKVASPAPRPASKSLVKNSSITRSPQDKRPSTTSSDGPSTPMRRVPCEVETPLGNSTAAPVLFSAPSVVLTSNDKPKLHYRTLSHDDAVFDTTQANYSMARPPPVDLQAITTAGSMSLSFTKLQSLIPREKISAKNCTVKAKPFIVESHDYLKDPNAIPQLEKGNAIFSFKCCNGRDLSQDEKEQGDLIINLSSFKDETIDNNVPHINLFDDADSKRFSIIFNKCAYLLPGVPLSRLTPQLLSSYEYQKACQPGDPHVWNDVTEENTFRMTKSIIRFIYSVTIQFRVSRISNRLLPALAKIAGGPVDAALLLERTKRDITRNDATAKAKSVLLYTNVEGGVLVTNLTLVLNNALPTVIAKLMNNFTSSGAAEVCETTERTRKFFLDKKN